MSESSATPPDEGALEIRRLLTAPNPTFERAAHKLANALPRGLWMETQPKLRLAVDPAVLDAVKQLRSAYRALWGRIDAIDTDRHVAKRHVLEAIDLLSASFVLILNSAQSTSYSSGLWAVKEAKSRQARGGAMLKQALEELA
jgi:hypothetical protein